jgi:hypothetical protein
LRVIDCAGFGSPEIERQALKRRNGVHLILAGEMISQWQAEVLKIAAAGKVTIVESVSAVLRFINLVVCPNEMRELLPWKRDLENPVIRVVKPSIESHPTETRGVLEGLV